MVKIVGYKQSQTEDGKVFNKLQLQGAPEAVQSKNTGKFYLTARTCYIPSTFDDEACKSLIGSVMAGTVEKVETEPYEYTVPETGEIIMLEHQWQYQPVELKAASDEELFVPTKRVMG